MKQNRYNFYRRINLLIGSMLTFLGVGATECNLLPDSEGNNVNDNNKLREEEAVDVVECKYGVPKQKTDSVDRVVLEPKPTPPAEEVVCIYGVPHVELRVRGTVTDKKSGKRLDSIEVGIATSRDGSYPIVTTDADGKYVYENDFMTPADSIYITFTDQQHKYEQKQIGEKMEFQGGTDWVNLGTADLEIDAQLVKQKRRTKKK